MSFEENHVLFTLWVWLISFSRIKTTAVLFVCLCCFCFFLSEIREGDDDRQVVAEIMARSFIPTLITTISWEGFHFAGHEIRITEAKDCYGAVVWPSV